jgi:hypothetical protein
MNTLPQMNNELRGKMVSFCLLTSQNPIDSEHSLSIFHFGNFIPVNLTKLSNSFVGHMSGFMFQETHLDMVRLRLSLVEENILHNRTSIDSM